MKLTQPAINNNFNEKIDTWVEDPGSPAKASIILVHGFGTNKHETAGYFDDLAGALVDDYFRVIRFDLTGYGNSQGNEEDACYSKHAEDLKIVVDWVKENYQEKVCILAQSMGCWVTALSNPEGIEKTIMTGIPNHNTQVVIDRVTKRFGSRSGAKLDPEGISLLPRSTGKIQKIGPKFWQDIKSINPLQVVSTFASKTKLLIVHWQQDEIIGADYIDGYDRIPSVKSLYLPGDHSLTNKSDRNNFIKIMLDYFNESSK